MFPDPERFINEKQISAIDMAIQFKDYYEVAKIYHTLQPYFYDQNKMWWSWNKETFAWELVDETDLLVQLKEVDSTIDTVSSSKKNAIIEGMKQHGRSKVPLTPPHQWIQFKDTIVDIRTGEELKASPDYFITNPIPHKLGEEEGTPVLDKFMGEWVGEKYVQTLQEVMAYAALPDYPIHRLFCFIGSGRNGKSTFLDLVTIFLGDDNCSSSSLDLIINNRFETANLYRKLVCQMGETNFSLLEKTEMIKKLTGRDRIRFEFKNKNPFTALNYAKIFINTNQLPATTDRTEGFYRRWFIIDFPFKFPEKADILSQIPLQEWENFSRKSVRLLREVLDRDGDEKFHKEGTITERMELYEEKSNPMGLFLKKYVTAVPDGYYSKTEFLDTFTAFCKENGLRVWNYREVNKYLRDKGWEEGKKDADWYTADGTKARINCWLGYAPSGLSASSALSIQPIESIGSKRKHRTFRTYRTENPDLSTNYILETIFSSSDIILPISDVVEKLGLAEGAIDVYLDTGILYSPRKGFVGLGPNSTQGGGQK